MKRRWQNDNPYVLEHSKILPLRTDSPGFACSWPGNVRELKQKIQMAVLHAEGGMITDNDLELGSKQLSSFSFQFRPQK